MYLFFVFGWSPQFPSDADPLFKCLGPFPQRYFQSLENGFFSLQVLKENTWGGTVMPGPQLQGFKNSGEEQELDSIIH